VRTRIASPDDVPQGAIGRRNARNRKRIEIGRTALKPLPGGEPPTTKRRAYSARRVAASSCGASSTASPSRLIGHRLNVYLYDDRLDRFVGSTRLLTLRRGRPSSKRAHVDPYAAQEADGASQPGQTNCSPSHRGAEKGRERPWEVAVRRALDNRRFLALLLSLMGRVGDLLMRKNVRILASAAIVGLLGMVASPAFSQTAALSMTADLAKRHRGAPASIAGAGLPVLAIGYGAYWLMKCRRRRA
jgi:hypothetical protein